LAAPARSGGEKDLSGPVDLEALEHHGEIAACEAPVEGTCRFVVTVLEATEAICQGGEVREVGWFDDLALDDREDDLD